MPNVYACCAHNVSAAAAALLLHVLFLSADKQWQATWAGVPRPSETEQ
jgi:hypothetical protein